MSAHPRLRFCARRSGEKLLLLEGAWSTVANPGAPATPLLLTQPDGTHGGRGGGSAGRGRGASSKRQQYEAPLAQLCMCIALDELEHAGAAALDAPRAELGDEQRGAAGGAGEAEAARSGELEGGGEAAGGDESRASDAAGGAVGGRGAATGGGEEADEEKEEVAAATTAEDAVDDAKTAAGGGAEGGAEGGGAEGGAAGGAGEAEGGDDMDEDEPDAALAALAAATYDVLSAAFRQAKLKPPTTTELQPVEGAEGWSLRYKPRARASAGQAGDVYLTTPKGNTIDSLRKVQRWLGLLNDADPPLAADGAAEGGAAEGGALSGSPAGASAPGKRLPTRIRELSDHLRSPSEEESADLRRRRAAAAAATQEEVEDAEEAYGAEGTHQRVRDGWEHLLHASSQHLNGTRGAALNPLAAVLVKVRLTTGLKPQCASCEGASCACSLRSLLRALAAPCARCSVRSLLRAVACCCRSLLLSTCADQSAAARAPVRPAQRSGQ